MPIRHILVALTGAKDEGHVAVAAMTLAKRLKAHVAVTCAVAERTAIYDMTGAAIAPGYLEEVTQVIEKAREGMRREARRAFDTAVAEVKLPLVNHPARDRASTWYAGSVDRDAIIADIGRLTDLVAVSRPHGAGTVTQQEVVEDVLFSLRRPVLVLPHRSTEIGDVAAVAWNGSLEAANALAAAVSLLPPDAKIIIIQVGELPPTGVPAEEAVDYLGWHGFTATIRRVEDKSKETAQIIQAQAKAVGAHMLVMGAFSHSRMREMLLGGVTANILTHAKIPVLMAH